MPQQSKIGISDNSTDRIGDVNKMMTAVDWLVKELNLEGYDYSIEQAKSMEKEQIMDAHKKGGEHTALALSGLHEQYYNETYNQ